MLTFVYPTESNREDVLSFYAEFEAEGTACIGCAGYDPDEAVNVKRFWGTL